MARMLWALCVLLGGCSVWLDGDGGGECSVVYDCLLGEVCDLTRARCVARPDAEVDADVVVLMDAEVDVEVDAEADAEVDAEADAQLDAEVDLRPFAPAGDCFDGAVFGRAEALGGAHNHVPRAFCTPDVLAWTVPVAGGVQILAQRGTDQSVESPVFAVDAPLSVDGPYAVTTRVHPTFGVRNVLEIDLRDGTESFIAPQASTQSAPVVMGRSVALVRWGPDGDRVELHDVETGQMQSCGREGRTQWGVALGPTSLGFFERDVGRQRTDVVVHRELSCSASLRVAVRVTGVVGEGQRIFAGAGHLGWLEQAPDTRAWRVGILDLADLGAGPSVLPLDVGLRPVHLSMRGPWLAVASYGGRGYVLDVFNLVDGRHRVPVNAHGNTLWPSLSDTYVLWAEQSGASPWEVHYEALD